ncbi:hypothetical protein VPH49_26310 [Pseudomonas luteola]|uniref:hypothetical protein n=1 Tax=Pseudomonas luteola TaxID=47886 RepID=UPI003A871C39
MIDENSVPPFVAYRISPKRRVSPVKIVAVKEESWGNWFVSDRRGTYQSKQLWLTEAEPLIGIQAWIEVRKLTLKAELAKLDLLEARTNKQLRELEEK